nr:zinc finger, CCHC-type [Tanacetum cinerariifolium]
NITSKVVLYKNMGFNENEEYKKTFIGSGVGTGSVQAEIWVTKGLSDEGKENIHGMEIFRIQSGNTLRVSQSRVYNMKLVQTLLEGHSIPSLKGSLSGDLTYAVGCQEYQVVCTRPDITSAGVVMLDVFDRGLQTNVHVFVDFNYAIGTSINVMGRSITGYRLMIQGCAWSWEAMMSHMMALTETKPEYMTLTKAVKEVIWLKGLSTKSEFEPRLVVGIATEALTKAIPGSRFQN